MKRGERPLWREINYAAYKVAISQNYAEEYMAKVEFDRLILKLATTQK